LKFAADRWAEAFINACESNLDSDLSYRQSEEGLSVLKSALYILSCLRSTISGSVSAAHFDAFLNAALSECGCAGKESGVEAARAMIFLLIKRDNLPYGKLLIDEIEDLLLKKQGILTVLLDCAEKPDDNFLAVIKKKIIEREKTRGARITVVLMPELLGGFRINIGNNREDFSILGQMKQLEQTLAGAI
jgi:F0F1-type ATP synthase delta subunit